MRQAQQEGDWATRRVVVGCVEGGERVGRGSSEPSSSENASAVHIADMRNPVPCRACRPTQLRPHRRFLLAWAPEPIALAGRHQQSVRRGLSVRRPPGSSRAVAEHLVSQPSPWPLFSSAQKYKHGSAWLPPCSHQPACSPSVDSHE